MHKTLPTLLSGFALAMVSMAHAQSPGGDMSRYESIYDSPKASGSYSATREAGPQGIQPGKRVETIGPMPSIAPGRSNSMGMTSAPQPLVRPGIPMTSGGTVSVAPGIVDKVPPQGASNADMPAPRQRTTEMITEDANGEVIERTTTTIR